MGFNFRKSIQIAPGVKLNIGKKGVNSVSFGQKGAKVTKTKNGDTKVTIGIPGTGISYTKKLKK